jgi:putative transposase
MPEYRRSKVKGGTYFFTVVTYDRRPIFSHEIARGILHNAWDNTRQRFPFKTLAICLLPDHLHCIWRLPSDDANYSIRWKEIKGLFTKSYLAQIGPGEERNLSRQTRREAAIWQRRFWEHTIETENDLEHHLDYIHYNPVKHGYVGRVKDWPYSSFHRYVKEGIYAMDWNGCDGSHNDGSHNQL